jgi:PEP-CTERM motif
VKSFQKSARRDLACSLTVLMLLAAVIRSAPAALLSEEHFSYSATSGSILSQNGGTGWSGPWVAGGFNASIFNNQVVQPASLTFNLLATSGNHTATGANNAITGVLRSFAAAGQVGPSDSVTRYLSFLVRPEGALNAGAFNGFFGLYLDGTNDDLFVGKPGAGALSNYVLEERGGAFQSPSSQLAIVNQTALLVLRADFRAGVDSFSLYVNPTPGAPESTFASATENSLDLGAVTGIVLYSTGAHSLDEIRWGETYADVTPIPEPATLSLAGIGLAVLCYAGVRRANSRPPHCASQRVGSDGADFKPTLLTEMTAYACFSPGFAVEST